MTGIPSIVAGLFAYALFVLFFGEGVRMGFGGSVALANLAFGPIVDRIGMTPVMLTGALVAVGLSWYADVEPVEERDHHVDLDVPPCRRRRPKLLRRQDDRFPSVELDLGLAEPTDERVEGFELSLGRRFLRGGVAGVRSRL